MSLPAGLHLDLDEAWNHGRVGDLVPGIGYLDCRVWGPTLRFTSPRAAVEKFYAEVRRQLPPYLLYGSGDYHYLAALWLRTISEPFTLVSFDNHPDWDTRPPHWCCGNWISRALNLPNLERASVWGCGNFELEWPNRLFANHRGLRAGRLEVHPWAERLKPHSRDRWKAVTRENWRERFSDFAGSLAGRKLYVTVDIDCLDRKEAVTNWENGLFTAQEIAWALRQLRLSGDIIGGDLCGAYSPPGYARFKQRIAAAFDHPRLEAVDKGRASTLNLRALRTIWPELTGTALAEEVPVRESLLMAG